MIKTRDQPVLYCTDISLPVRFIVYSSLAFSRLLAFVVCVSAFCIMSDVGNIILSKSKLKMFYSVTRARRSNLTKMHHDLSRDH